MEINNKQELNIEEPKVIKSRIEISREYYAKNRAKHCAYVNEKVPCDICICHIARCRVAEHKRSAKHIKNMKIRELEIQLDILTKLL
jgi:hypothetical protein